MSYSILKGIVITLMLFAVFIDEMRDDVKGGKINDGTEVVRILRNKFCSHSNILVWSNTVPDRTESRQRLSINRDVL